MGKVKKFRKKYNSFCVRNKLCETESNNISETSNSIFNKYSLDISALENHHRIIDDETENRSVYSISKSIKSNLSGRSIKKKDKRKLRHELFLKKVNANSELLKNFQFSKKYKKKNFKDTVPLICNNEEQTEDSAPVNLHCQRQIPHNTKGISKIKHKQFVNDLSLFKKVMSDHSLSSNPHEIIQNKIVEKLSQEYHESPLI